MVEEYIPISFLKILYDFYILTPIPILRIFVVACVGNREKYSFLYIKELAKSSFDSIINVAPHRQKRFLTNNTPTKTFPNE